MYSYQKNNIHFRILSSNTIAEFKKNQSDTLFELTRAELNFFENCKESVLLEFDRFSLFVYRLERICLLQAHKFVTPDIRDELTNLIFEEFDDIEDIQSQNTDVFGEQLYQYINYIHDYSRKIINEQMDLSLTYTMDNVFAFIVKIVSDYLDHFLIAMHEYNSNINHNTDEPFICSTNFYSLSVCPEVLRCKYLKTIANINTYRHKNYTQDTCVFENLKRVLVSLGIEMTKFEVQEQEQTAD